MDEERQVDEDRRGYRHTNIIIDIRFCVQDKKCGFPKEIEGTDLRRK